MVQDSSAVLRIAVIGARDSTSVERLLRDLPETFHYSVVVSAPLSIDVARAASRLPVHDVSESPPLEPGHVYMVPVERDFRLQDGRLVPSSDGTAHLDTLMRSVADEAAANTIVVVLAGRGHDGSLGIQRIKEAGGLTIAEDTGGDLGEMPRSAIATGLVDLVLPIEHIADRMVVSAREETRIDDEPVTDSAETLRDILTLVRVRTGHDFTSYKRATIYRRILRRMQVCECTTITAYHSYLRDHPNELVNLLRDFLISVTQFFRDPPTFELLARDIIPRLFLKRGSSDPIRVWVAGCATGEEAYSLGILLLEHVARVREARQIQIFATDLDEKALSFARLGCYPESIAVDVSPERLFRFFVRENENFRVHKDLRERVLFSPHSVLRDPPFSRLDLISCRNLLIYLDRDAQTRVLTTFHFGLRPDGLLLLGSSESAEGSMLFSPIDAKHRVFSRRPAVAPLGKAIASVNRWNPPPLSQLTSQPEHPTGASELHYRLLEHYAPPSLLVGEDLDVLHMSESVGRFMQVSGGEPTRQLLRLIHPALRFDVRTAIYAARQAGMDARTVHFVDGDRQRLVEIRARAVDVPDLHRGAIVVMFAEQDASREPVPPAVPGGPSIEPVVREMEEELHRTRDQLRSTVEQYETSLEELKASNEELQAINDELRSATEELETSKEELQSINEELITLNHELKVKVDEVSRANSDLQNLMTSTEIGVVFLDRGLRIKRFTPRAQDLFNVIPSDLGRPLAHLTHRLEATDLADVAQSVLHTLRSVEREIRSTDGRAFLARWLPYRSLDDRIEGVVMTFVDVTDLRDAVAARRRSEAALLQVEERLRIALSAAPIVVLQLEQTAATWGFVMGRELESTREAGLAMFAPDHADRLLETAREVIARGTGSRAELDVVIGSSRHTFDFRIEPSGDGATAVGFDITPSKLAERSLRDADRRKDEFLATLSHELRNPLAPLQVALEVARLTDDDPAQRAQSLSIMERQVAMLTTLVDELLDLSRVTQGKIVLERSNVSLAHVLESAVIATQPMFEAAHHQLRIHAPNGPIEIEGDRARLVQVFTNLLSNAAKYTLPNGHIEITVTPGERTVSVLVHDDGLGIDPEMLPRIFEIFVQCRDARGRSQGGLGIGLNLARRLVELHGGMISATSDGLGHGSTFLVELPLLGRT